MAKILNWTEPAKPKEGVSSYDHVMCDTPLGKAMIEWKSWKDSPTMRINMVCALFSQQDFKTAEGVQPLQVD